MNGRFDDARTLTGISQVAREHLAFEGDLRIRGGSWNMGCSQVSSSQVDDVMHSSDQFNDLGFADETSLTDPDTDVPDEAGSVYFYVVRFYHDAVTGPWGFGSAGQVRTGSGGCPP